MSAHQDDPFEGLELDRRALTIADHAQLRRRLRGARKIGKTGRRKAVADAIRADLESAAVRFDRRRRSIPDCTFPAELPISARRDELVATVRNHQVTVIAGETGSGKSTQLPKVALEAGFGVRGTVGHTQPRRIAAAAVGAGELDASAAQAIAALRDASGGTAEAYAELVGGLGVVVGSARARASAIYGLGPGPGNLYREYIAV